MVEVIPLVALAAMALVGLDLALRPGRHVAKSAGRVRHGGALPLEKLSHRLFPKLENASTYRLIGIAIIVIAALLAAVALGFLGE